MCWVGEHFNSTANIKKGQRERFLHCTREDLRAARARRKQHHQESVQQQQSHAQAENNVPARSANTHIETIKPGRAPEEIRL